MSYITAYPTFKTKNCGHDAQSREASWKHTQPLTNITKSEKGWKIEMAIPGLEKSDVEISVKDDMLTLASKKDFEKNENTKYFSKGFFFGRFEKQFKLNGLVDIDNISASYNQGVLAIELPFLAKETSSTKIEIK